MKQLKLSRLFSLLLALTLALTPCLAGLAEEGNGTVVLNATDNTTSGTGADTGDGAGTGTGTGEGTGTGTGEGTGTGTGEGTGGTTDPGTTDPDPDPNPNPDPGDVELTGIEVSPVSMTLEVGGTSTITVKPVPDTATLPSWTATASNTVVSISGGTVKAESVGDSVILVKAGAYSKTIQVKVVQKVNVITVTPSSSVPLTVGDTLTFTATVSPENANQSVEWSCSPATAATLTPNGNKVTVKFDYPYDQVTITAKAKDGSNVTGSATVKVLPKVESVSLDKTELKMTVGSTASLKATVLPEKATQKLKYESSKGSVATVNGDGVVTAVAAGTTIITATSTDGTNKSASCTVTVGEVSNVPVTGVKVSPPEVTLDVGGSQQLEWTVEPSNATNKKLIFKSSDDSVATVSNTGYITAVKNGNAVITVTSDDNNTIYGFCKVKVGKPVLVASVSVTPEETKLKVGATCQLNVNVLPSNADNRGVSYESSNTNVATVSENGLVTAKASGVVTITVTAKDGSGKKATSTVTVWQPVTGVTVSEKTIVIPKGNVKPIFASVVPATADEKGLVFKTSNATVATVSNEGVVTGVNEGWATITICAKENEAIYTTCTVKVGLPVYVESITLDIATADMWVGSTRQLGVSVLPANADIKDVSYGSSDNTVATVSSTGLISAKKSGKATITVTATDGSGKSATCVVTVKQRVTSISITPNGYTLTKGSIKQLEAKVGPDDAANKEVTWSSSNPAIAAVSADGHVTAVNEGSCVITATSKDDPSVTASCTIVVGTPVTSVSVAPKSASMNTGETILISASVLPTNASNKGIIWSWTSSDGGVITLTNGSVKALKAGTVIVTAKAADNSGKEAYCTITITGTTIATPTPTPVPTPTPTPGPVDGIWCRVNTEKGALNVRDKIGGAVIDKIPEKGTFLVVNWGTTWCQVYYNGRYGYVMTKFVQKISSDPSATPSPAPTAPAGQTAQVNTAKGALNMRDKIGGAVIAKIPEKAYFIVTEYGATWCKAWYDGKTGYVMTKFVKLTGGDMPTPTPVPTLEPVIDYARVTTANGGLNLRETINGTRIAVIPQGATVSVHSKGADWSRVSYSGKTGYVMTKFLTFGSVAPTETPTPAPEVVTSYARVNTVSGGLNLRETPNGTRIAVIPQNAVIGVITKGADWSRVKYGDKVGYVMTKFLADTTATPAPTTPPTPGDTLQCYGKVTTANGGGLNMRSGPATTYGRIASIKNGGVVEVYDKGAVWSRIKYNGTFGYVMSQYLTFSAERPSEDPDPVIPSGAKAQVTTTAGSLNLRAGMGTTYALIGKIPQKAYVEVLTYGPSWCYVSYNGLKGYVMTTYLTMIN